MLLFPLFLKIYREDHDDENTLSSEDNFKLDLLSDSLNEEFYYVKVLDESSLEIDPKVYEKEVSLKGEFIRNVLSKNIDEEKTFAGHIEIYLDNEN